MVSHDRRSSLGPDLRSAQRFLAVSTQALPCGGVETGISQPIELGAPRTLTAGMLLNQKWTNSVKSISISSSLSCEPRYETHKLVIIWLNVKCQEWFRSFCPLWPICIDWSVQDTIKSLQRCRMLQSVVQDRTVVFFNHQNDIVSYSVLQFKIFDVLSLGSQGLKADSSWDGHCFLWEDGHCTALWEER